jgi:hypothetical protein
VGLDPWIHRPDLQARPRTSTGTNQTPRTGPGPLGGGGGPGHSQTGSRDPGRGSTRTLIKPRRGSGADTCPGHAVYGSPHRRRPDAATWPTVRELSQWAEPNVRPLGHTASAFNADKVCRLSTPLAGDVPPQH